MRHISTADFDLLKDHALTLKSDHTLELDIDKARLAIALLWDFRSWEELESSVVSDPAAASEISGITPSDLMRDPAKPPHPETTTIVLRQIGRMINHMQLFPALSARSGVAVPNLYGYQSINELSKLSPASLESYPKDARRSGSQPASRATHAFTPVEQRAFTGAGSNGATLVFGGEEDRPLAFSLSETIANVPDRPIELFLSTHKARGIKLAVADPRVNVTTARTLTESCEQVIAHMKARPNLVAILSLDGFAEADQVSAVLEGVASVLSRQPDNHLIVEAGLLRSMPASAWMRSQYQVLLSHSLASYPARDNPLSLSPIEIGHVVGFTSNRPRDFAYMVMEERRNALLVYTGVDHPKSGNPAKAFVGS